MANRIFYLSIPPTVFVTVAQNAARSASSTTGAPLSRATGGAPLTSRLLVAQATRA